MPSLIYEQGVVDIAMLSEKMQMDVAEATVRDQEKMGGLSADVCFLDLALACGEKLALVHKTAKASAQRAALGLAREALAYNELGPQLDVVSVPRAYYASGDMSSGECEMLLECLEGAVPAGAFFGAGNPNNWADRERLDALCDGNPPPEDVTLLTFRLYARLHGAFWRDVALLEKSWLRGADWCAGEGREGWDAAQAIAQDGWAQCRAAVDAGTSPVVWDPHLVACLDAAFGKVGWAAYRGEAAGRPHTLVHGDAHPHNWMWTEQRTDRARPRMIDLELVGLGSGAQELGQYAISHAAPALRREHERAWVEAYHTELVATLRARGLHAEADAYTLDACFAEYVAGGAGRWAWFVPLLTGMASSPPMAQFFHDQLAAFLHDHVPEASAAPMPRV